MSSATNAFEDLGYFCVDNLPITLLPTFARLVEAGEDDKGTIERAALVIDIREGQFLGEFEEQLRALRKKGLSVVVLFFEASDEALARRFSETRRPHPADTGGGLFEAIRRERVAMKDIRALADLIVDTRGQTARRGGTLLPLTTKEYALLEYLARNVGRVVGRADISAHVWDDNHDPGSNAIDVCVTRLRRKVDNGREPLIHTRRGAGYLLAQLDEE